MENQLEKLISDYFKRERTSHRVEIFKFRKKILDENDLFAALSQELGFNAVKEKIESFQGYNPQREIDSLIYNYDKRGWLYIELATRDLSFIDASKYPYPRLLIDKKKFAIKVKCYLSFAFLLFLVVGFLFLLVLLLLSF